MARWKNIVEVILHFLFGNIGYVRWRLGSSPKRRGHPGRFRG